MKTLIASIIGLGLLAGTANAQYVGLRHHGYSAGPEICAPQVVHQPRQVLSVSPRVVAAGPTSQPVEAPAVAAPVAEPLAPSDAPAQLQAPLPPS